MSAHTEDVWEHDDTASRGVDESAYLERGLAVVVLQVLISTPKQQHAGTAVLQRRKKKSVCKAVAQASSREACSQGDLTRIQRNENAKSTGGHLCSSEGPGGRWTGPGCCQLKLHCCKDFGEQLSRIYKNFKYIHPTGGDSTFLRPSTESFARAYKIHNNRKAARKIQKEKKEEKTWRWQKCSKIKESGNHSGTFFPFFSQTNFILKYS